MSRLKQAPLPAGGGLRVHPAPQVLPQLRHEGPGAGRFDDPLGQFQIRYVAATLEGCLVETMARFRPDPHADALLAAVTDVADTDPGFTAEQAVGDWLEQQQIGSVTPTAADPLFIDVEAADLLVELDVHPLVRYAIDTSPLAAGARAVHLDSALIRLAGAIGRPITQAVARAIHEQQPGVDGIAYWSRIDSTRRCWAIYGHVPVDVTTTPLSPDDPEHRAAVQAVAHLLHIPLPPQWRQP